MGNKKAYRFLIFFLLLLIPVFKGFCVGGNVFHEKNPSVIKTRYFDIIFSEKSFESACKIASVADGYYEEIAETLGTKPDKRFPVSISDEVESLNGFFTPAPYNLIVLYDSFGVSPLQNTDDTITSVFYHELSHAVTLNYKSRVFSVLSAIFGDFCNPAGLSMSFFWIEGEAVLFESIHGQGRLYNPFFTQLVTQAKIESINGGKKFPSWRDVYGARDIFPGGTDRYAFGACFADYLVNEYGMDKYSLLWKNAGTSTSLSFAAGIFKKTYGVSLTQAWKDFYEKIEISDFTEVKKNSLISHKKSIVRTFDCFFDKESGKNILAWYDARSGWIYSFEKNKVKKLLYAEGTNHLRFSPDGKKIAVTRIVSDKTQKSEAGILNLENGKYRVCSKEGMRDAFFAGPGNEGLSYLDLSSTNPFRTPVYADNNLKAVIYKEKNDWFIRIESGEAVWDYPVPFILDKLHLSFYDGEKAVFSFVWAEKIKDLSALSRAGFFEYNLKNEEIIFYFQKSDIALGKMPSGVLDSYVIYDEENNSVGLYYISAEYENNPLYYSKLSKDDFVSLKAERAEKSADENALAENKAENRAEEFKVSSFSSIPYYLKGLRVPFGLVPVYDNDLVQTSTALLGITYAASNPWLDNLLLLSGGYDFFTDNYGLMASLSGNDGLYSYNLNGTAVFKKSEFSQTTGSFDFSRILKNGRVLNFSLGINSSVFYGNNEEQKTSVIAPAYYGDSEVHKVSFYENGIYYKGRLYFAASNIHKFSQRTGQYAGLMVKPFVDGAYEDFNLRFSEKKLPAIPEKEKYVNLGFTAVGKIPFITPLTVQLDLFPQKNYLGDFYLKSQLFVFEVQKGIPAVSLFMNRISVFASYTGIFKYKSNEFWDIKNLKEITGDASFNNYNDKVSLNVNFEFCGNTGYMADPATKFVITAFGDFRPHPDSSKKKLSAGITGSLAL